MAGKTQPVSVEIYGQSYNVRGEGDPAYLTELARVVDGRMREIAPQVATGDPTKIAILAALNIADEFSRYRQQRESDVGKWKRKTEDLIERLGASVIEAAE
ncbi:MAG TPA: cell division protein ZapA [Thermoanaerobaculia bacterium]|nr:cell division protein ZapA [Thermoanaerobaculia bacterium]